MFPSVKPLLMSNSFSPIVDFCLGAPPQSPHPAWSDKVQTLAHNGKIMKKY